MDCMKTARCLIEMTPEKTNQEKGLMSEEEFREMSLEHYGKCNERFKREKERDPKGIIGKVDTDEEIKKMIDIDVKNWLEASNNNVWGFRRCNGARVIFK